MGLGFRKLLLVLAFGIPLWSFGPPLPDLHKFSSVAAKFREIPDGAYLEGSDHKGGIQPEYLIDMASPEIQKLNRNALTHVQPLQPLNHHEI